ncbi:hypothetical protein D3H64_06485 [Atopobacter sp. AH10]|uniref:RNA-binding domain-containing protein n=1 Tax=Atopobacter sp. AH10 TaxID=2315861 RepID=UPI000EF25E88|nr:RNA-binding domain-containing protein [Atopobacter sp. AH10]RLK63080.1 hypothetical protein D3H64_06485 [Atopobacter sp. AH10]
MELTELLCEGPSERVIYRKSWYKRSQQDLLLKDVLSCLNSVHHDPSYIIFGVGDFGEIIGVEGDPYRKSSRAISCEFRRWPLDKNLKLNIEVKSQRLFDKTLDVMMIPNIQETPVTLTQAYPYRKEHVAKPDVIYYRNGDLLQSISIHEPCEFIRNLYWKKTFAYFHMGAKKQFPFNMGQVNNWSCFEVGDEGRLVFLPDPDFQIWIKPDRDHPIEEVSYALYQGDNCLKEWKKALCYYKGDLCQEIELCRVDNLSALMVEPDQEALDLLDYPITIHFYAMVDGEFKESCQRLLNHHCPFRPSYWSRKSYSLADHDFNPYIVHFCNIWQRNRLLKEWQTLTLVRGILYGNPPSDDEGESFYKESLKEILSSDDEMLRQLRLACFLNELAQSSFYTYRQVENVKEGWSSKDPCQEKDE